MRIRYPTIIAAGLLITGMAGAAPPHAITYVKKSVNPGTVLNISGNEFTVVRMPIRDFTGTKYAITLPVPSEGGVLQFGFVSTTHSTDPLGGNLTIDGFEALVQVIDGRSYSLLPDFTSPGTNRFQVQGSATAIVRIQVGSMVVDLFESFLSKDPLTGVPPDTDVNIGAGVNAVSFAEWWKYTDPVTQVNALDNYIDFIRIIAL